MKCRIPVKAITKLALFAASITFLSFTEPPGWMMACTPILVSTSKKILYSIGVRKIDYIEILNINKIIRPFKKNVKYKIFLAYFLGDTRLIDNI